VNVTELTKFDYSVNETYSSLPTKGGQRIDITFHLDSKLSFSWTLLPYCSQLS